MTIHIPGRAVVAVLGLALVVGACGSDNSSSSSTPSTTKPAATTTSTASQSGASTSAGASAALCSARDALNKSLQDLTSVDVVKNGTSSLQTALTNVKTNLEAVKSAASSDLQPQVKAVEDSLTQLQTAVTNASSGGVAAIVTAATAVAQNGSTLLSSLQSLKCS